jgi:hypothetical protein
MKKTDMFKIETVTGIGHISTAARLVRSLMGVEWGDVNSVATELTVTYDDCWITSSGIALALMGIGVTCKIFAAPARLADSAERIENRTAKKIKVRKQEYRCESLRSPKLICGCY